MDFLQVEKFTKYPSNGKRQNNIHFTYRCKL